MKSQERMKFWCQHIEVQKLSRVSVQAYCDREKISTYSFYQWRKRLLASARVLAIPAARGFASVEMIDGGPGSLPASGSVKLPDPKWTAALVSHLLGEFAL